MKTVKTLVQMKLSQKTIARVEALKKITGIDNRTAIVAQSLGFYLDILSSIKNGDKVIIERKNGDKEILKFVGISI
jgi:hypothetical protein